MALEAAVLQPDMLGYNGKDFYSFMGGNRGSEFILEHGEENGLFEETMAGNCYYGNWASSCSMGLSQNPNSSSEGDMTSIHGGLTHSEPPARNKRRRCKSRKNKEDIENQRMTHIAVERNRRKQMNEYLSALRSLMPESFVQRGDQASIIGGAINFVKELEQRLHLLGRKEENVSPDHDLTGVTPPTISPPFSEFFTYPQYSTNNNENAVADVEVTVVESHASLKIRSRRRPKQLLELISGLQSMRLTVLHLNVTTVDQTVLYSISVKVEDDCRFSSVDDIATAAHDLLARLEHDIIS